MNLTDLKGSCELEIRERAHAPYPRQIIQINMGCKQTLACQNNHNQNFQSTNPAWTQESILKMRTTRKY